MCGQNQMRNLITASGIEQEKPRPDQAGVGVLVSPEGFKFKSEQNKTESEQLDHLVVHSLGGHKPLLLIVCRRGNLSHLCLKFTL